MNAVLRVLPLALGSLCVALALHAETTMSEIPAIFSDVAPRRFSPPKLLADVVPVHIPISDRMRAALRERVVVRTGSLPIAVRPPTQHWSLIPGDAILMESYIVNVPSEKKVEVQRSPTLLYDMWTTGELYTFDKSSGSPKLMLSLGHVRPPIAGTASTAPRVELSLSWRW